LFVFINYYYTNISKINDIKKLLGIYFQKLLTNMQKNPEHSSMLS